MAEETKLTEDQLLAIEELNIRNALKNKAARWLVWQILDMSGINATEFSSDPAWASYTVGRQSLGRDLLVLLQRGDPEIYPRLILENLERNNG